MEGKGREGKGREGEERGREGKKMIDFNLYIIMITIMTRL
jgi:hypothetical protein